MEMPKTSGEQKQLNLLFTGTWQGEETIHASELDPIGGLAFATWVVSPSVDGFALLVDYDQQRGGKIGYRGHGIHAWDSREKCFFAFWFDNIGIVQRGGARAVLDGNRYSYELESPKNGRIRMLYTFEDDAMTFTIERASRDPGKDDCVPVHEGRYLRLTQLDVTS